MMKARGEIVSAAVYDKVGQAEDNISENEGLGSFDGVVDRTVGVDDDSGIVYQKGEIQPRGYKDKWFAVAFLSHFLVLIGLTATYAPMLMDDTSAETSSLMDGGDFQLDGDGGRRHLAAGKGRLLPSRRHLAKVTRKTFNVLSNIGKSSRRSNRSLEDNSEPMDEYLQEPIGEYLQEPMAEYGAPMDEYGAPMVEYGAPIDEYGAPTEIPYYGGGGEDESFEEMEADVASYYDDELSKEEAVEALDEIIEEYYEEEVQGITEPYHGGDIMNGMSGSSSSINDTGGNNNNMGSFGGATDDYFGSYGNDREASPFESIDHFGAIFGISLLAGLVASPLFFYFLMNSTKLAIKASLFTNIGYFAAVALIGGAVGDTDLVIKGVVFTVVSVFFGLRVWKRVAFSASLLKASTSAVTANAGIFVYGIVTSAAALLYYIFWAVCSVATVMGMSVNSCGDGEFCEESSGGAGLVIAVFFLVLCFYWTIYVCAHVLHVTVAGMVGTYWFSPMEASSCCSKGVNHSFVRATTDSFGSICFGSLLIAVIETLRSMARSNRRNILTCIIQCLLYLLAAFMEIFNRWALVYVGLYGYSFVEAGTNVVNLFKSRGWTSIVSECMIASVIRMANLTIGIATGVVTGLASYCMEQDAVGFEVGFWVGFIVGVIMAGNIFGVLLSASETVFVCFAEAPTELQENHPELGREMNESWAEAWPEVFQGSSSLHLQSSENRNVV